MTNEQLKRELKKLRTKDLEFIAEVMTMMLAKQRRDNAAKASR